MGEAALKTEAGTETIIELQGITKTFWRNKTPTYVLKDLDLSLKKGAFVSLMGPSGSGKSTLLNLIAGIDRPTEGTVRIGGQDLSTLSDSALAKWRADHIGFVFQAYNLMPVLTARQNVELPLTLISGLSSAERRRRAETALQVVGLGDRMDFYPRQLSGGQEQRVTIARAIVNDPTIIVADEPTGDLDRETATEILNLLKKLNEEFEKTIFMVTHDPRASEYADQIRQMDKGKLQ